jgi:hypothetical protein
MSQVLRRSAALLILAGCGRTDLNSFSPATTDGATGTDSRFTSLGSPADTRDSANDSADTGPAGQCGSQVTFQIAAAAPDSLCAYGCDTVSTITLASGSSQLSAADIAYPLCEAVCDSCDARPLCPSCPGISPFPAAGISRTWDGSYLPSGGTCGTQPCRGPRVCAPAGHYTGTFCAMRGSVVGSHCTPLQGTQATACATVEFDLPSTATIAVAIGP